MGLKGTSTSISALEVPTIYVLERLAPRPATAHPHRRWTQYAFCGNSSMLERVIQGQRRPEDWRIVQAPGSIQSALLCSRGKSPVLMAG